MAENKINEFLATVEDIQKRCYLLYMLRPGKEVLEEAENLKKTINAYLEHPDVAKAFSVYPSKNSSNLINTHTPCFICGSMEMHPSRMADYFLYISFNIYQSEKQRHLKFELSENEIDTQDNARSALMLAIPSPRIGNLKEAFELAKKSIRSIINSLFKNKGDEIKKLFSLQQEIKTKKIKIAEVCKKLNKKLLSFCQPDPWYMQNDPLDIFSLVTSFWSLPDIDRYFNVLKKEAEFVSIFGEPISARSYQDKWDEWRIKNNYAKEGVAISWCRTLICGLSL